MGRAGSLRHCLPRVFACAVFLKPKEGWGRLASSRSVACFQRSFKAYSCGGAATTASFVSGFGGGSLYGLCPGRRGINLCWRQPCFFCIVVSLCPLVLGVLALDVFLRRGEKKL